MPSTALERMRHTWDGFARRNAMYYIATRPAPWTTREFFASGGEVVKDVLGWASPARRDRMLDLGCGLGRTAVGFADHFDHVDAIDISPAMIERAQQLDPPPNVRFAVGTGSDLGQFPDGHFDLVFSMLVFQHIPDPSVIDSYVREIARVLAPDGRTVLQFDTRRPSVISRLYERLPRVVSTGTHRPFIRRYRRDRGRLGERLAAAGLHVLDERNPGCSDHLLLLARAVEP